MTIANEVGFLPGAYQDQVRAVEGTRGRDLQARGYANPLLNQISTWTVAGADATGTVSVTIILPNGESLTASGNSAAATDTSHADAIVLAINTTDAWSNVATATNVAGVITVAYIHTGLVYTFSSFATPGSATIVETAPQTQAAGGVRQPAARWVTSAANAVDPDIPALGSADGATAAQLVGVVIRPAGQIVNTGSSDLTVDPAFEAGDMVPVGTDGTIQVTNHGSVASVRNGAVFVVVNTAGGQEVGLSRADADGGNTVQPALNTAYWVDPTGVGATGLIRIRR